MHPNFIPTLSQLFPNRSQLFPVSGWDGCGTATESWDHRNHKNTLSFSALRVRLRSVGMVAVILATSRIFTIFFSQNHTLAMTPNFRKIQQTYSDALRMTSKRSRGSEPIGEEGMSKFLGGGKVLYYNQGNTSETIVVSKIASRKITIIWGAQGSGKTGKALELMDEYKPEERAIYDFGFLQGDINCLQIPNGKKVMVIDQFPVGAEFGVLLAKVVASEDKKTDVQLEHIIACVQYDDQRFEPSFIIGAQLGIHPVNYVRL